MRQKGASQPSRFWDSACALKAPESDEPRNRESGIAGQDFESAPHKRAVSLARFRRACQQEAMPLLDNATVLITGASAGLGAEFARQVATKANRVILAARRVNRLRELAAQIARDGLIVDCLAV